MDDPPRPAVVVGVDGSAEALRAARWAAAEAGRHRCPLRLVSALGTVDEPAAELAGFARADVVTRLHATVTGALDAAESAVRALAPDLAVERAVVPGPASQVLVEESRSADAVVVGERGRGGLSSVLAGSVAVTVAAHAYCPVVVVRGAEHRAGGLPVVVGVDSAPESSDAVAFAFAAASSRSAPLVAVHTWSEVTANPAEPLVDWPTLVAAAHRELDAQLSGWAEKYPDVAVTRRAPRGGAATVLLEAARLAQLVVVGSRGRGPLAGLLWGSVGNALVHAADCPVAIVRHR